MWRVVVVVVVVVVVDGGKFGRRDTKSVASTSTKDTLLASGRVRKDYRNQRGRAKRAMEQGRVTRSYQGERRAGEGERAQQW